MVSQAHLQQQCRKGKVFLDENWYDLPPIVRPQGKSWDLIVSYFGVDRDEHVLTYYLYLSAHRAANKRFGICKARKLYKAGLFDFGDDYISWRLSGEIVIVTISDLFDVIRCRRGFEEGVGSSGFPAPLPLPTKSELEAFFKPEHEL